MVLAESLGVRAVGEHTHESEFAGSISITLWYASWIPDGGSVTEAKLVMGRTLMKLIDIGGRFAYDDTKDELEAASTNSTRASASGSHCEFQASHSHTPDFGSDSDEGTIAHAGPDSVDLAATPHLTASSVSCSSSLEPPRRREIHVHL